MTWNNAKVALNRAGKSVREGKPRRKYDVAGSDDLVTVTAKCLACRRGDGLHEVTVPRSVVEPGKILYRYCERHKNNRYFDVDDYDIYNFIGLASRSRRQHAP